MRELTTGLLTAAEGEDFNHEDLDALITEGLEAIPDRVEACMAQVRRIIADAGPAH